jgi:hypothetical protein
MTIKDFDWEKWKNKEHRVPTDEESVMLIKMIEECHWCIIRDILIDSGLADESFPIFWYDVMNEKLKIFRLDT